MKKTIILLLSFFLILSTVEAKTALAPKGSPKRAIQDLDERLNEYIIDAKTEEQKKFNLDLKKTIIHGTFDVAELCRLALDKHWQPLSQKERDGFIDLMTNLLERKAIFSKEQSLSKTNGRKEAYYLSYGESRLLPPDQSRALVKSTVTIPQEDIRIDIAYKLKIVSGAWKIFDVTVDGASLLNNYRYQFDKIISKDGYPDLVRRMSSKLKELEETDKIE
ncbi:MAG: ABC transporter substrate-binding protein, partial [bacterium]|nr:ABC transporter substrate-binding protein [bacterium]